ncbi:hypothetical protein N665_1437s0002 [Sinapis alba]|nr:hypothetical protein N665_1437s0002 [Sinapis alba]
MKHTKGKQKIEMKKVEGYKDRMIHFQNKMNEIVTLCDVEASFLVFSQTGKPHTFAHPSMEDVVGRVNSSLRHEPSGKDDSNTESIVEAYKRQNIEELMKKYDDLAEELEIDYEKEKMLKESKSEWWNIPDEGLSVEELKRRHQMFIELHNIL